MAVLVVLLGCKVEPVVAVDAEAHEELERTEARAHVTGVSCERYEPREDTLGVPQGAARMH